MEIEDYQLDPAYLLGRIEALERMIHAMAGMLPEMSRDHVGRRLGQLYRDAEADVANGDTDRLRSRRSGIYETYILDETGDEAEILAEIMADTGRNYTLKT